ncbi:Double-stranded RNA-binding protein 5 [Euphorbia peplus]|nr:Double-stranded RNA-binding protein 5 [Euphorbia peplus]
MYKMKLQELCHHNAWTLPDYAIIRDGPDHCPRYQATFSGNGRSFNSPSLAPSSKKAQNDIAKVAFDFLSAPAIPSLPSN